MLLDGKADDFDYILPEQIDHLKLESCACVLAKYVKCYLAGQMWSRCPAFADKRQKEKDKS